MSFLKKEHERLLELVLKLPQDYEPFGSVERWKEADKPYPDCSSGRGCTWAKWLNKSEDWCVCTNEKSHRCGLLTFEHQGCQEYQQKIDIKNELDKLAPEEPGSLWTTPVGPDFPKEVSEEMMRHWGATKEQLKEAVAATKERVKPYNTKPNKKVKICKNCGYSHPGGTCYDS